MADFRGQVIFESIAKTYPIDAHIECSYVMKATHQPSAYDWIGIFKVGWSSVKDVNYYLWAPLPADQTEDTESRGHVLFQAMNMPKEDGEFYQFVYFNVKSKMCGASSPFQFRAPRSEDFVEEEMQDDEDMLFITTRQVKLEEKLDYLEQERLRLSQTCETLTAENSSLKEQLKAHEIRVIEIELERNEIRAALQDLRQQSDALQGLAEEKAASSEQRAQDLKQEADDLTEQNRTNEQKMIEQAELLVQLQNQRDHLTGQVEALRREKELFHAHSTTEEASKQQALNEVEALRQRLNDNTTEKEFVQTLQAQLISSQESIQALERTKHQQKGLIDTQHDKLQATEARHVVDAEEISALNLTLTTLSVKVETVQTENYEYKQKLDSVRNKYKSEKQNWNITLDSLAKEKNGLLSKIGELNHKLEKMYAERVDMARFDEQEDRYIALQAAYTLLKDELSSMERELVTLKHREAKLKGADKQVKDLQQKLKLGEQNWKKANRLSRSGSESGDMAAAPASQPAASTLADKGDLTNEELLMMVEQLNSELELRTQKKDRYKIKYLEEKQRAATMRDYYKGEMEKQRGDLELARAQLDIQIARPSPIVYPYPPVPPTIPNRTSTDMEMSNSEDQGATAKKVRALSRQSSSQKDGVKSKGALEQSLIEDTTDKRCEPLKPLPAPIEPLRVSRSSSSDEPELKDQLRVNLTTPSQTDCQTEPFEYPNTRQRTAEVIVISRNEDSDEDNEGPDRFHDASDVPTASMAKCCVCDKIFDSTDSGVMRNDHVNGHYEPLNDQSSLVNFKCPICQTLYDKSRMSQEDFNLHVNAHFATTN